MTQQAEMPLSGARASALDAPRLYRSVRTRRMLSFVADYTIVLALSVPLAVLVFVLGILSFGLAWGLYAILLPLVAIPYIGLTMGGAKQATPGMRLAGLRFARLDGGRVDPALAVLHGVLFWASTAVLTPFVLLVGLATARKQLLHDLLLGTVVVRTD